jgi:hypothetical protein
MGWISVLKGSSEARRDVMAAALSGGDALLWALRCAHAAADSKHGRRGWLEMLFPLCLCRARRQERATEGGGKRNISFDDRLNYPLGLPLLV